MTIGGGPGVLTAINTNQALLTSTANDTTEFSGAVWWPRGVAGVAARFTGFQAWSGYNPWGLPNNVSRFFALNDDRSLWLNEGVVLDNPGSWKEIQAAGSSPTFSEIAAAGPTDIFGLDTTAHLWHGTMPVLLSTVTYWFNVTNYEGVAMEGSVTVNADGSWTVNHAYIQWPSPDTNSIGYNVTCTLPDLSLTWSGQVGANWFSAPTQNLSGSGTTVAIANDWYNVMSNAHCTASGDNNDYICGSFNCNLQSGGW